MESHASHLHPPHPSTYVVAFLTTEYTATMPDGTTKTETPKQTLMRRYQQETNA